MAAHRAPSVRRQLHTTALTSLATALAVVGLMFAGSALSSSPPGREPATIGTTTGPVALLDAPAAPRPTSSTTPAVGKSSTAKPTTSTKRPTTTTTTTTTTEPDD